jgi:tRNA(Ile)-lysidine synthase
MLTTLEQRVLEFIRHLRMMAAGHRVAIAVSGGADSVALLRMLEALRGTLGITLLVAHFDHMLRGSESDADADFVAALAGASSLEFVSTREDVRAAAAQNGWNIEDAARRLRYAFFNRILSEQRACCIAVAHTANDQAETVLGHVMRGTGLTGLAGIHPIVAASAGGSFVRPFLHTRREDLREYLKLLGQAWREDSTNLDQSRQRARIRAQLLPVLERDFSPTIVQHLGNLARLAREDESLWEALVEGHLLKCVGATNPADSARSATISVSDLLSPLPFLAAPSQRASETTRALTERLIRRLYEKVRGDRCDLSSRHVEQVIRLATESTSGKCVKLPGKIHVERVFDELVFSRAGASGRSGPSKETKLRAATYHYVVSLPQRGATTISVPELATRFRLKMVDWPLAESDTKTDGEALDAAALRIPLILRNWQPGDAYRPRGHRQPRKLKQMFLAGRIPSSQRAHWPVLESAGQVVWARGMAPAEEFRAREGTRVGVVIEEDRL